MEEKILLLGATGTIGKPLVNLFQKSKIPFSLGVFPPDQHLAENIENKALTSFDDHASLQTASLGIDTVFIVVPDSPNMVLHIENICKAMKANKVKHFVYVGGLGVTVAPDTWLSKKLLQCEEILLQSGINGAILRPGFFMQNFIHHYPPDSTRSFYLPVKNGKVNYIDVRDVAAVAYTCLTDENFKCNDVKFYHLTGQNAFDHFEIANIFSEILEKEFRYESTTLEKAKKEMSQHGTPDWLQEMLLSIYTHVQCDSYSVFSDDFSRVTQRQPIDFRQFVRDHQYFFQNV